MPVTLNLQKASLTEMWPGTDQKLKAQNKDGGPPKTVTVQFNPQSMKLNFTNQNAGGDQPNNSPVQFVGKSATKLTLELWFDVSLPLPEGTASVNDVRQLTKEVAYFLTPQPVKSKKGKAPPGVKFQWGTFLFQGVVDSMDETLEYFSSDGRPLRAGVNLALSKQDLVFQFGAGSEGDSSAGTQAMQPARENEPMQQMAAKAGLPDWKAVAGANGIENPRMLAAGALVNLSAGVSVSGGVSVSASASLSAGAGINVSFGGSSTIGGSLGASASAQTSASGGLAG